MSEPDHSRGGNSVMSCPIASEFRAFRIEANTMMNQVAVTHKVITEDIAKHTKHLEKLDDICVKLDSFTASLIGAVTGKKQVSTSIFLVTVFLLSAILLVVLMKTSGLNLEISSSGLRIESSETTKSRAEDTLRNAPP